MIITCHVEDNSIFYLNSSPIMLQRPVKEVGVAMNAPATLVKRMIRSMDNRCMLLEVPTKQPMVRRGICYLQQEARGSFSMKVCIFEIPLHPLATGPPVHQLIKAESTTGVQDGGRGEW